MRKILIISILIFEFCFNSVSAQILTKPKLIKTYSYSGPGDYLEFIDNTVAEISGYIKESPKGKAVALVCSKDDLPTALVSSVGFPLYFFQKTQHWSIPTNQVYLARSAKCSGNSKKVTDQYWFVPENSNLENDEIILAENISYKRSIVGYYENYESQAAKKEFNGYIEEFIKDLKDNPKSNGFIVSNWNNKKTNQYIQKVLQQLKKQNIRANQVKVVRKKKFYNLYPEFFTVKINEENKQGKL